MKVYTAVNGKKVIASEPIESPISAKAVAKGLKPVFFKGTMKLLLEDDTETFGCVYCGDHVEDKLGVMRFHQTYDCPGRPPAKVRKADKPYPFKEKEIPVNPATVFGGANGHKKDAAEPPPSEVSDILAALLVAKKQKEDGGEVDRLKKIITGLQDENTAISTTRAEWEKRYRGEVAKNKKLEGEVQQVRTMLKELGILQ